MDNTTRQVRLEHWTQIVRSCTNSGLTKKEWCEQNHVPIKSYYYWQRVVRQNALTLTSSNTADNALTEIEVPTTAADCQEEHFSLETCFHPDPSSEKK